MRGVGRIVLNEMARYQMELARRVLEFVGTRYAIAGSRAGAGWVSDLSETYRNLPFLPVASWIPRKKTNVMSPCVLETYQLCLFK